MADKSTSGANHGQCLPETASRCLTESFTATHNFELTNYPLLEGMGVGKFVSSSAFSVSGHDWNIRCYPDGMKEDSAGSVSVFLCHLSPAKDVRTKLIFKMRDKEGKEVGTNSVLDHTFSLTSDTWGYPSFLKIPELKSTLNINSGFLTIMCNLTVIKNHVPRPRGIGVFWRFHSQTSKTISYKC
jgi:speckle-type POZ protein